MFPTNTTDQKLTPKAPSKAKTIVAVVLPFKTGSGTVPQACFGNQDGAGHESYKSLRTVKDQYTLSVLN